MPAAIQFQRDGYTTAGQKLMGRNAAGESFLRAVAEAAGDGPVWGLVETAGDVEDLTAEVRRWSATAIPRPFRAAEFAHLRTAGTLYTGDPRLAEHAWRRAPLGTNGWSLCGITHSTSSYAAMDAITDLVSAPIEKWDALICTSTAVKANVELLLEGQREYLREQLGAVRFPMPQLPVIPLGVHTADFVCTDENRREARSALDISEDAIVVLYVGRLSAHSKASPIASFLALERAAARTKRPILLVEYGLFPNDLIADAFAEAAAKLCPTIRRITLDGRNAALGKTAWACADIFCSLADNVQEAFGITPVEAMAAGLPIVVSDWDGYRDTVRDGVDGFRIPTTQPRAGAGQDIALRQLLKLDSYDRYIGYSSAMTAVDIEAAADAFAKLFASDALRKEMGASGKRRACELYDWAIILRRYEALWDELADLRRASGQSSRITPPARRDPFALFAEYPTHIVDEQSRIELSFPHVDAAMAAFRKRAGLKVISFAFAVACSDAEVQIMLESASAGPTIAREMIARVAPERHNVAIRSLGWLMKLGIIRQPR